MDLCLVKDGSDENLDYYTVGDVKSQEDHFNLLGFMDSRAVINKADSKAVTSANPVIIESPTENKQLIPRIQVDESGDKYINLNGQKLRVVPQGQIPKEIRKQTMVLKHQMINIGSLKKPLKVRVISGATQINEDKMKTSIKDKTTSNTTDKLESCSVNSPKKFKLITVKKIVKTPPSNGVNNDDNISDGADCVIPKVEPPDQGDISEESGSFINSNPTVKQSFKLLTHQNLEILNKVKMQALNLSKKNIFGTAVSHASVQTDYSSKNADVQTDIQLGCTENLNDVEAFCRFMDYGDSPIVNDVNMGQSNMNSLSPVHVKQGYPGSPSKMMIEEGKMRKKLNFFKDLHECLIPTMNGNLMIHEGVASNDVTLVKRMSMALKLRGVGVDQENHNGCTPLQMAVINNAKPEIVQILLDNGADIQEADGEGNNILHLGAKFERHEILRIILNHSVIEEHPHIINNFNFDGLTPLMICCTASWTAGAMLFVEHGAKVNLKDQTSGRTALFHAAEAHNDHIVRLLLDSKADPKIKNFFGTSPHDAMYELDEMPEVIKNLIFGKTKLRTIANEMNPLHTARAAKKLKTYPRLIKIEPRNTMPTVPISSIVK